MTKYWTRLYEIYFQLGYKHFSFHVEDSRERRKMAQSIRTYLFNHKLEEDYKVRTVNKTITITHKDFKFGGEK